MEPGGLEVGGGLETNTLVVDIVTSSVCRIWSSASSLVEKSPSHLVLRPKRYGFEWFLEVLGMTFCTFSAGQHE